MPSLPQPVLDAFRVPSRQETCLIVACALWAATRTRVRLRRACCALSGGIDPLPIALRVCRVRTARLLLLRGPLPVRLVRREHSAPHQVCDEECAVWCMTWCVMCAVWVCAVCCVVCGVCCVVCGVRCVLCGVWCLICAVWCVICAVWCVICAVLSSRNTQSCDTHNSLTCM